MKKTVSAILVLILAFAFAGTVFADYPKSDSFFYDGVGIISDEAKAEIKSVNDALFVSHGMRIAVCVVETTNNIPPNTYARGVFGEWKVNGVLLLIVKDVEYYYAAQSSGISDVLTDDKLFELLNNSLESDFDAGNYSAGVSATVKALASYISENVKTQEATQTQTENSNSGGSKAGKIFMVLGIIILILAVLAAAGYGLLVYLEKKQERERMLAREERRRRLARSGRGDYYGDPGRPARDPRDARPQQGNNRPAQPRQPSGRVAYPEAAAYNRINSRPQNAQRRPAQTATRRPPARGQRVDFDREYFTGSLDDDFVDPTATREFTRR